MTDNPIFMKVQPSELCCGLSSLEELMWLQRTILFLLTKGRTADGEKEFHGPTFVKTMTVKCNEGLP